MLRKGGILLLLLLCVTSVSAQDEVIKQDEIANLFRLDNPNLMTENEPMEYTGAPLVYIQGVKPPEKAHNAMEELQLALFGTKDVQKINKDTLELSKQMPPSPTNQIYNYTFQNPFHQTIQAAFIPHIPSFMVIIQVMNQQLLTISEHITVMNTTSDTLWTKKIALPQNATATVTEFNQNGQFFPTNLTPQKDHLTFESPVPLELGPNQISLTYQIEKPFNGDQLDLEIIGTDLPWTINQFKVLALFPMAQTMQEGNLTFGTNRLSIPDIYTQQTDATATGTLWRINRIIPPKASIQLNLKMDLTKIPAQETQSVKLPILTIGLLLMLLYWLAFAWWTKRFVKPLNAAKIKRPKNIILLATQMGVSITENCWQKISDFYTITNGPDISAQHTRWQKHPISESVKATLKNIFLLTVEVFFGSLLLVSGIIISIYYLEQSISTGLVLLLLSYALTGCILLYLCALSPLQKAQWKRKLNQLSLEHVLTGLTSQQIEQIYPLFIVARQEQWRQNLVQVNPNSAQKAHLL